jgi:D-alanine-D-alanine ligase
VHTFRVALLYNLKVNAPHEAGQPADAAAELDSEETVQALQQALEAHGHRVIPLEGDVTLYSTLQRLRQDIDIAFNICEGHRGDSRESQVPAMLEMLGIPYTASKILAQALSLNKAMAKLVWMAHGLPTAAFQVFQRADEPIHPALSYPLFAKPVSEGTAKGIDAQSIIQDEPQLRQRLQWLIAAYQQPALVETFLPGREFTVGLLGNPLAPGEQTLSERYDERGFHLFPVLEIDTSPVSDSEQGIYTNRIKSDMPLSINYLCPADIEPALKAELKRLAVAAFLAIDGLDVSRVDFRLDGQGQPHILEINTLPGMNPKISDLCIMARAEGVAYDELVNDILYLAARRAGLLSETPRQAVARREPMRV